MSEALDGIWFPIANNHRLYDPINDQPADGIQPISNPLETMPGKSGRNRKPPIRFPVSNKRYLHNPITDQRVRSRDSSRIRSSAIAMFDISADRIANNGKPSDSFHVRRFSDRADAERYLDELVVRFKGNKGRDEQGERWSIREVGTVTRYSIGAQNGR
jgi:hypothetical protein